MAHDEVGLELLKSVAAQRLHAGQDSLDFGDGQPDAAEVPIRSTQSKRLWEAWTAAYGVLGFDQAYAGDEVFRGLVLGRIIHRTSKLDTVRVLDEVGSADGVPPFCAHSRGWVLPPTEASADPGPDPPLSSTT